MQVCVINSSRLMASLHNYLITDNGQYTKIVVDIQRRFGGQMVIAHMR